MWSIAFPLGWPPGAYVTVGEMRVLRIYPPTMVGRYPGSVHSVDS